MKYIKINEDLSIQFVTLTDLTENKQEIIEDWRNNKIRIIEENLQREIVPTPDDKDFTQKTLRPG